MDFACSDKVTTLQRRLRHFMAEHIAPVEAQWRQHVDRAVYPLELLEPLKARARAEGLWNLFLPGLRADEPGTRLTNLEYAPLAEIMGRVPWAAEVFNCSAPDTGNIELLHTCATPEQADRWLRPLLAGEIRSCFAMTEPDVASSDATNIRASIRRQGNSLVINGHKWFVTGAAHPNCKLVLFVGRSEARAGFASHERHSIVLVPLEMPGVQVVRSLPIMHHHAPEGHCEVVFRDVRLPLSALLGEEGRGFALAQARLGPGRVHHCMRAIGQCELALELMCERARQREAFGRPLSDYASVQDWIAHSRVEIDQARLLVLRAAWTMDRYGNAAARTDVSAIKLVVAQMQARIVDRAMQVFGAAGLTSDTPLASLWTWGRALRFIDGPDEVHSRTVARSELAKIKSR
ncbi:MAG TPA: acyl-CoA dehydrogenase family protein [Steroidobacteraceae bacterium]|jgi:acyl-CoA dehydrogenase|nr:acyl-CoA dehydrogenase family protein [Steroidobacteraceae bacterium]HVY82442.1 acyl-CoA dehydrogenase family protein [Steroidobacteraceae bacterium]